MKLSISQLANALQLTKRTIQRHSQKEQWPFSLETGLGGARQVYEFEALPLPIQTALVNYVRDTFTPPMILTLLGDRDGFDEPIEDLSITIEQPPQIKKPVTQACSDWLPNHPFAQTSPPLSQTFMNDRPAVQAGLLTLALAYAEHEDMGKIKGLDRFCQRYNGHEFVIQPCVYRRYKRISRITLHRWQKASGVKDRAKNSPYGLSESFEFYLHASLSEIGINATPGNIKQLTKHLISTNFVTSALMDIVNAPADNQDIEG